MRSRRSVLLLVALGASGCGSSSPKSDASAPTSAGATPAPPAASSPTPPAAAPAPPPSSAAPTASAPAPSGGTPGSSDLVGKWTSPKCGPREYPRNIELRADGAFTAEDLVSPCPPNVQCAWSGVVSRKGLWSQESAVVTLATTKDRRPPLKGASFGGPFAFENGKLVEMQGTERCAYARP